MPLAPWEDIREPLAFPVGGKVYTPPSIDWDTGVTLTRLLAGRQPDVEAQDPEYLWGLVLGPCFAEMKADKVPMPAIGRAGFAALVEFQTDDRAAAERVWVSGLDPEARAALAAAIREQMKAGTQSPSTASGSPTRTASTAATTSRKATRPAKSAGARSASTRSSRSGG